MDQGSKAAVQRKEAVLAINCLLRPTVVLALAAFTFIAPALLGTTQESETRANRSYESCIEQIFPRPETAAPFRNSHSLVITLRRSPNEGPETQITLFMTKEGTAARALFALSPIREQLASLFQKHPAADPIELCAKAKVHLIEITSAEKPHLLDRLSELKDLRISPVFEPDLILHADMYELWTTCPLDEAMFRWYDVPSEPRNPLTAWAEKLLTALQSE